MQITKKFDPTFNSFILTLQQVGLFRQRSISINQVTLATQSSIRPGKTFPINLSDRTLGEVPLSEVVSKTTLEDFLNLRRITKNGIVVELQQYIDETGMEWGPS